MSREHQVSPGAAPHRTADRHDVPLTGQLPLGGNQAMAALLDPPTGGALLEAGEFNVRWMADRIRHVYDWLKPRSPGPFPASGAPMAHQEWARTIWRHQVLTGREATGRIDAVLVAEVAAALLAAGAARPALDLLARYHQDIPFPLLNVTSDEETLRAAGKRIDGPYFITGWDAKGDLTAFVNRLPQLPYEVTDFVEEARGLSVDRHLPPAPELAVSQAMIRNIYYLPDQVRLRAAARHLGVRESGGIGSLIEGVAGSIAARQQSEGREPTGVVDERIALGISLLMFQEGQRDHPFDLLLHVAGITRRIRHWADAQPPPAEQGTPLAHAPTEWIKAFVAPDGVPFFWCARLPATPAEAESFYAEIPLVVERLAR